MIISAEVQQGRAPVVHGTMLLERLILGWPSVMWVGRRKDVEMWSEWQADWQVSRHRDELGRHLDKWAVSLESSVGSFAA